LPHGVFVNTQNRPVFGRAKAEAFVGVGSGAVLGNFVLVRLRRAYKQFAFLLVQQYGRWLLHHDMLLLEKPKQQFLIRLCRSRWREMLQVAHKCLGAYLVSARDQLSR